MTQLFRGRGQSESGHRLERELQSLEQQARAASPGYETQFLNRAGNLCAEAGQTARALGYYGRAIDAYLESGRFNAAEVLCSKVLRLSPDAVRARCTLAWLAIGKGYRAGTDREIGDYVAAARGAGKEYLAVKQLRMMSEAAFNPEVRELLGEHLLDLGEYEIAEEVLAAVNEERNGIRRPPVVDEAKLWAKLLRAALMGPEELKEQVAGAASEPEDDLPSFA